MLVNNGTKIYPGVGKVMYTLPRVTLMLQEEIDIKKIN